MSYYNTNYSSQWTDDYAYGYNSSANYGGRYGTSFGLDYTEFSVHDWIAHDARQASGSGGTIERYSGFKGEEEIFTHYDEKLDCIIAYSQCNIFDLDHRTIDSQEFENDEMFLTIIDRKPDGKDFLRLALKRAGFEGSYVASMGERVTSVTFKQYVAEYFELPHFHSVVCYTDSILVYYDESEKRIYDCQDFLNGLLMCIPADPNESVEEMEAIYDDCSRVNEWKFVDFMKIKYGVDYSAYSDYFCYDLEGPKSPFQRKLLAFYEQLGDSLLDMYFIQNYMGATKSIGDFSDLKSTLRSNRNFAAIFIKTGMSFFFEPGGKVFPKFADTFEMLIGVAYEIYGQSMSSLYALLNRIGVAVFVDKSNGDNYIPFDIHSYAKGEGYKILYKDDSFEVLDHNFDHVQSFPFDFVPTQRLEIANGFWYGSGATLVDIVLTFERIKRYDEDDLNSRYKILLAKLKEESLRNNSTYMVKEAKRKREEKIVKRILRSSLLPGFGLETESSDSDCKLSRILSDSVFAESDTLSESGEVFKSENCESDQHIVYDPDIYKGILFDPVSMLYTFLQREIVSYVDWSFQPTILAPSMGLVFSAHLNITYGGVDHEFVVDACPSKKVGKKFVSKVALDFLKLSL